MLGTDNVTDDCIHNKMSVFEESCRRAGLKMTFQRMEIFRELASATDHPSAEALYGRLRQKMPTLSLDTLYRSLTVLEQCGLARKVLTVESQARFEAEKEPHHHLICDKCKNIIDFYWQMFDHADVPDEIRDWGYIKERKAALHGICRECLGYTVHSDSLT